MSIYYITPIIGAGTMQNKFRSGIAAYGVSYTAVIPNSSVTGLPLFTWVLVAIPNGTDTTAIDADATFDKLPITSLDVTIGSLTNQQRTTLRNIGTKYGVAAIAGLTNQSTCRDALDMMGKALDPNFDASTFGVL